MGIEQTPTALTSVRALDGTPPFRVLPCCQICGSNDGIIRVGTEMMFGLGGQFEYFECAGCGCTQLVTPPADMRRYYPARYYSFEARQEAGPASFSGLRGWLATLRNEGQMFGRSLVSRVLARYRPSPGMEGFRALFSGTGVKSCDARILDIGCGSGELLRELADVGFKQLVGVDPFLSHGVSCGPIRIYASNLTSVKSEKFGLVMLHHSLEHISDQVGTLKMVASLLCHGGTCLIRVPVVGSHPWQKYGMQWVELDAPRHVFLHTKRSIEMLAARVGMEVYSVTYDSEPFAYWASEMYCRGLCLYDEAAGRVRDPASIFSCEELSQFRRMSDEANASEMGGRARFLLRLTS